MHIKEFESIKVKSAVLYTYYTLTVNEKTVWVYTLRYLKAVIITILIRG
jgi:hypothetical protein